MSKTLEEVVADAEAAGVQDAYEFAEWQVQIKEVYGDCSRLEDGELELAYEEQMSLWRRVKEVRA